MTAHLLFYYTMCLGFRLSYEHVHVVFLMLGLTDSFAYPWPQLSTGVTGG